MRAIRWACVAVVCLSAPAAAQPPDVQEDADGDDAAPEREEPETDVPDAVDPDSIAASPGGETIEIVGRAPLAPAQATAEQMSRDEIDALPGGRGDAFETVRSLPGVAFAPAFDGAGDLAIRGTRGADSFYLVDGVPVPQTMHFGNLTAVLPVEMIESIELLPGGFDVSYGRATGGIVEVHTRRARADRWSGAADISFVHASAFAQGPLIRDELSVAVSVRRSFIDLLLPSVVGDDGEVTFNRAPRYSDAQLRLDWAPSYRHEVSLLGLYSGDSLAIQLDTENAQDPVLSGQIGSSDSFWRAVATWRYDGVRVGSRAAVSYGRAVEKIGLNDTHFLDSRPDEITAREDLRVDVSDWLRLRAGADARVLPWDLRVRMPVPPGDGRPDPVFTTSPVIERDQSDTDLELGGYLAADVRPVERLTVTPGVRLDHFSHIDATVPQPRIATELRLGGGWSTRASVGRFSRPHSLAEALPDDLDPETAVQATAGVEQRITPGIRASVTAFHSWLDNLAVYDASLMTEDPIDSYVSSGSGKARGLEVLLRMQRDNLFGWLAYTYTHSRRVDAPGMPERRFDYDQPHNLVAAASWKLGKWTVGGRFRYASGLLATPVVGSVYLADQDLYQPVHGATNSARLEASHQLDLRVDRRFQFDAWTLSAYLDVSNVYANPRVFDYSYEFDYSEREPITDLPILPSIGVRGEF